MFGSWKRHASQTAHTQGHRVYPAVGKWSVIENYWTPPGRNGERTVPRNFTFFFRRHCLTSAVKRVGSFRGLTEIRRWLNFNWLRSWTLKQFSFQKSQRMRERLKRRRNEGVNDKPLLWPPANKLLFVRGFKRTADRGVWMVNLLPKNTLPPARVGAVSKTAPALSPQPSTALLYQPFIPSFLAYAWRNSPLSLMLH